MSASLSGFLGNLHFSKEVFDWMREALRQSAQEKAEFTKRSIERLHA